VDWWIAVCLNSDQLHRSANALGPGPYLKQQYQWNNQNFATIVIAFRVAYSVGQTVSGRLIDRIGTRKGLTITVIWYSIAAMLTSLAGGLRSFAFFRFLLGAGESANWPAATKAVAEWFPKKNAAGRWRFLIVVLRSAAQSRHCS
jgi:ACS family hexuronate transporter-like MFS transporter